MEEPGGVPYCTRSMTGPDAIDCLAGCGIASALAIGLGALLHGCGVRRAWIAAGLCVGVLLGAQGLGRVRGAWHDRFWYGAASERREAFIAARAIDVAQFTAMPQGASVDSDFLAAMEAERRAADMRVTERREHFDAPALWVTALLAAFVLISASPLLGRTAWWSGGGPPIGAWSIVAPAALVVAVAALGGDGEPSAWWLLAVAVVCVGAANMRPRDRWNAVRLLGTHAHAIDATRAAAGVGAMACVLAACWIDGVAPAAWLLPWGAAFAAWGLLHPTPAALQRCVGPAVATATAVATTRLDPLAHWNAWAALGCFIAAEDLKWLGAAAGLSLWSRAPMLASLRACLPLADASTAQAALAAVASLAGLLPPWMSLALLTSAAAVELLGPVRLGTALRLDEALHGSREA